MSLADEIANDYEEIDGVEDVTLTPRHREQDAQEGIKALRRPMRRELAVAAQMNLPLDSVVFHLWASTMGGLVPQSLDKITAGSETFTIQTASKETLGTRWRCLCSKL